MALQVSWYLSGYIYVAMLFCTPQCALRFTQQTTAVGWKVQHPFKSSRPDRSCKQNPAPESPSWAISKPATPQHFHRHSRLLILAILIFILAFRRSCAQTSQVFPMAVMEFQRTAAGVHCWKTVFVLGNFSTSFTARFVFSRVQFLLAQSCCYECICSV